MSNQERSGFFRNLLLGQSRSATDADFAAQNTHRNCLSNVVWCTKFDPFVRLLIEALGEKGCAVNLERHIACEPCKPGADVKGGFDQQNYQLVICENNVLDTATCCEVLAHELVHAFDACRAHFDVNNLRHVACTEIRAYNLLQCSFGSALRSGLASFTNLRGQKKLCVRENALRSVLIAHKVGQTEARQLIDEVFEQCYADLAPIWRHARQHSLDGLRAYSDHLRSRNDGSATDDVTTR